MVASLNINLDRAKSRYERYLSLAADPRSGGAMSAVSAAVWTILLEWQETVTVPGDLLEIGVWHGLGAAHLQQYRRKGEQLILIDKYVSTDEFKETIDAVDTSFSADLTFIPGCSIEHRKRNTLRDFRNHVRFVHIDGEHSFDAVVSDLNLCADLVVERGIVAVDDVFMSATPCITEALYYWLSHNREKLTMFLVGYGKAYLCSSRVMPLLLPVIFEFPTYLEHLGHKITLCASGWTGERNAFGIAPYAGGSHQRIGRILNRPSLEEFIRGDFY